MPLNNQLIIEDIKRKWKIPGDKWKWKCDIPKYMECSKSSSKREVHAYIQTSLKTQEKISNKHSHSTPKGTRKRRKNKIRRKYLRSEYNKWNRN